MQFIPLRPEITETTNDQSIQLVYILSEPLYVFWIIRSIARLEGWLAAREDSHTQKYKQMK